MSFTTQLPAAQEYVYVIHATGTNRIKLGFSTKPKERLAQLQTGSPFPLQMLACWPGSRARENRLHRYMAQFRQVGEWFEVPPFIGLKLWELVHKGEVTGKVQPEKALHVPRKKADKKERTLDLSALPDEKRQWLETATLAELVAFDPSLWRIERSGSKFKQVLRFVSPRVSVTFHQLTQDRREALENRPGKGRRVSIGKDARKLRQLAQAVGHYVEKLKPEDDGDWRC